VRFAFKTCLGRLPTDDELRDAENFLKDQAARYLVTPPSPASETPEPTRNAQRQALADFGHMLLSANEFVYVD
jgi:hypothetical protein